MSRKTLVVFSLLKKNEEITIISTILVEGGVPEAPLTDLLLLAQGTFAPPMAIRSIYFYCPLPATFLCFTVTAGCVQASFHKGVYYQLGVEPALGQRGG